MKSLPYKEPFYITQEFLNSNPIYKPHGKHMALDMQRVDRSGDIPIYSINNGMVVFTGSVGNYGNTVVVKGNDPDLGLIFTRYSHFNKILVTPFTEVKAGQTVIGVEGNTGLSVGGGDTRHLDLRISKKQEHSPMISDYFNIAEYLGIPNKRVIIDPSKIIVPGGDFMKIVFYLGTPDLILAERVAKKEKAAILPRTEINNYPGCVPYIVGGTPVPGAAANICGNTFEDTCLEFLKFMGKVT